MNKKIKTSEAVKKGYYPNVLFDHEGDWYFVSTRSVLVGATGDRIKASLTVRWEKGKKEYIYYNRCIFTREDLLNLCAKVVKAHIENEKTPSDIESDWDDYNFSQSHNLSEWTQ